MSKSATELLRETTGSPMENKSKIEYSKKLKDIETTAYLIKDKASKLSQNGLSADQTERALAFLCCRNMEIFNMLQELFWLREKEINTSKYTEMSRDYSLKLFDIEGNEMEGFVIKGPIIPKKTKLFQNDEALFFSRSLRVSVKNYLENNKISTPVYSNADVIFTLCFPKNFPQLSLPDADNLETKGLLDALGMLLIENDSMVNISYTMQLKRSESVFYPHTIIHIIPSNERHT